MSLTMAVLLAATASVPAPTIRAGDSWIYRSTEERAPSEWKESRDQITVVRATSSNLYLEVRPAGSSQTPRELVVGRDWTRRRDMDGHQTVVSHPLQFPLQDSSVWDVEYTDAHPSNAAHLSEHFQVHYAVSGWEDIDVSAGHYRALKIEGEGEWSAVLAPRTVADSHAESAAGAANANASARTVTERPVSGRLYKAFWYVPEVGRWVKSLEEYYSSTGVRNERSGQELESFTPAP